MPTRVLPPGTTTEEIAEADLEYWLQVPGEERLALVWELSRQQWDLLEGDGDEGTAESRSPRFVASIRRR
jgi:hypothetical protein